jgi:hypothetical protein
MCNIHLKHVSMLEKKRTQQACRIPFLVHSMAPLHFSRFSLLIRFWAADCLVTIANIPQNSAYDSNKRDPI